MLDKLNVTDSKMQFFFLSFYKREYSSTQQEMFALRARDVEHYREIADADESELFYDDKTQYIVIAKSVCERIIEESEEEDEYFREIVKKYYNDDADMCNETFRDDYEDYDENFIYISINLNIDYMIFQDFEKILTDSDVYDFAYNTERFECSKEAAQTLIKFYDEIEEMTFDSDFYYYDEECDMKEIADRLREFTDAESERVTIKAKTDFQYFYYYYFLNNERAKKSANHVLK